MDPNLCSAFYIDPMRKKKIEFTSHTGNLVLMRDHVRRFLDTYPFSQKERMLMVLGVEKRHEHHSLCLRIA